jgi:uncharacterized protein YjbI with pentapeptide repeats
MTPFLRASLASAVALLALLPAGAGAQAARDGLALFPYSFYGSGANSIEPGDTTAADTATAYLRTTLDSAGRFAIVEPGRLESALVAARTPIDSCTTLACRAEVAKRLGARYMITAKLSKTSNLIWFLSGQLTDLTTGKRLLDEEYELKGQRFDEARLGSRVFARRAVTAVARYAATDTPTGRRRSAAEVKALLARATEAKPADLSGADLRGIDLSGVDLTRADLTKARLDSAKLVKSNLFSADLTDARLTDADLRGANLDGTTLRRANFEGANLEGASLFATIVESADLSRANLARARIIGYLRGAKLAGASLRDANVGADPGNQSMGVMRAAFVGADLSGADLTGANLFKADFSHANLSNAKLAGADLRNSELVQTDFTHADLTGAKLDKANLDGTIFTGIVGRAQLQGLANTRNREKAIFDAQ